MPQYNETDYSFLGERSQKVHGLRFDLTGHHMKPNTTPGELPLGTQAASSSAEGYPIKWPDLPPPEEGAHGFPIELTDASVADIQFQSGHPTPPTHQHGGTDNANFATTRDTSSPDLHLRSAGAQVQNQMGANMLADNSMSADPSAARSGIASDSPHELGHVVQGGSPADTTVHEVGHNIVTPGSHVGSQGTLGEDTLNPDSSSTSPDSAV